MTIYTEYATVDTSDATVTVIWTSPAGFEGGFSIHGMANEAATGDAVAFWFQGIRSDFDNQTLVSGGSPKIAGDVGTSAWSMTVDEGTNQVRCRVTGEAAHDIKWTVAARYWDAV